MLKPNTLLASVAALSLSACTSLIPAFETPDAPVPETFPAAEQGEPLAPLTWQSLVTAPQLEQLIEIALADNRDLRQAAASIQIARANYGISRAQLVPTIGTSGQIVEGGTIEDGSAGVAASQAFGSSVSAQIGVTAYELDLFGRVSSANESALQSYFSTVEGARATRVAVIASVVEAWVQLAADRELLALAEDTVDSQSDSLALTRELFGAGVATELDVRRASASVETARAQAAQFQALIRQDLNALRFLVGAELPQGVLQNATLSPSPVLSEIGVGQSSNILLSRPDVRAAERSLLAANADIGVARAAYFPIISLTGSAGAVSADLEGLFEGPAIGWSFGPSISLPLFDGGARDANLEATEAARNLAVAQYEQAIQNAFRETADALAVAETIDTRLSALERLAEDSSVTLYLSDERFRVGVDDYLSVLDAQRADYAASQSLIEARRDKALNAVALFRALGGTADIPAGETPVETSS